MTAPYILYGGALTRATAVQMLLEEGGIPYELREVDILAGEHRAPEFLALNPAGYVPALVTPEGEAMSETCAMLLFLAERHGRADLAPAADDPERARFLSRLFFHANDLAPAMKQYFYPHRYVAEGDVDGSRRAARRMALDRWSVLDRWLVDDGPYHLGERFSLLDLHMTVWASYGFETVDDITDDFPAVKRVVEHVRARPRSGPLLEKSEAAIEAARRALQPSRTSLP